MSQNDTNIPPETPKDTGVQATTPVVDPSEVIITPDDGPAEHVRPEDATDTTPSKPKAPAPTSSVAAGLAWQGGARPQQSDLAALRARVENAQAPVTPKPATIPEIPPTPLQPVAPTTPPEPIPHIKPPVSTLLTPPEIGVPQPQSTHPTLRTVRTFKDDMAQVITKQQVSVVSAISAEENRRSHKALSSMTAPEETASKGVMSGLGYFILGISVSLLLIGGAGVGAALYFFKEPGSVLPKSAIPAYITVEEQRSVNTDGLSKSQLLSGLIKVQQELDTKVGSITQLYFIKTTIDPAQEKKIALLLPATDLLALLETHAPGPLVRSLEPKMMFGFYQFDQVRPFIILKTTSYETAFASMLDWERDLNADLAPLFGPAIIQKFTRPIEEEPLDTFGSTSTVTTGSTSSSTVTETPARTPSTVTTTLFLPHSFEDAVIVNKDVRVLRDDAKNIVLIYGFYDKQTILITPDENTFKEVVTRLSSRRF